MAEKKIYTKTGDQGESGLYSGQRVLKTHVRMVVCGTLDELNSQLGVAVAHDPAEEVKRALEILQPLLFELGSDVATTRTNSQTARISQTQIQYLEKEMDAMSARLPRLRSFIIPGGSPSAASLHVARTVCRRGERELIAASQSEEIAQSDLIFINRLSDYLFVLARLENLLSGYDEIEWMPA